MKRFKNILFFADGSTHATWALERAILLARTNGARLTVLAVLSDSQPPDAIPRRFRPDLHTILRDRLQQQLDERVAGFREDAE